MKLFAILLAIVLTAGNRVLLAYGLMALQHGRLGLLLLAFLTLIACGEMVIKPLFRLVGEQEVRKHLAERGK